MEAWQINLSLIPSIAVILTSSNRMSLGLTDEINTRLSVNEEKYKEILPLKIQQLKRISMAVFLMYLSLSLLIINALFVGLGLIDIKFDKILIFLSVVLFLIAIIYQLIFSWNAYFIRQKQFQKFLQKN